MGNVLFNETGGSIRPIYGSMFYATAEYADQFELITVSVFESMLEAGLTSLQEIVQAQVGDKTIVGSLSPAFEAFRAATNEGKDFKIALENFKYAADKDMLSARDMAAKFGRSSRLGERSRDVLDAGAVFCNIILQALQMK